MSEQLILKINDYFGVQRFAFAAIGIDVLQSSENLVERPFVLLLLISAMGTHVVAMFIYGFADITDIYRITDTLVSVLEAFMSFFKIIVFLMKRRKIVKLVQRLWQQNLQFADEAERTLVADENEKEILLSKLFRTSTSSVAVICLMSPLAVALIKYKANDGFKPRTPLKFDFWLDYTKPLNYCLIYIWNAVAIYGTSLVTIGVETLFSWFVHNIVVQFHILEHRMRQAALADIGHHASPEIIKCIRFHSVALQIAQDLNDAYAEIVFVNFILSYLHIGSLAFRFARADWGEQTVFHAIFLISVLIRMALYCFGGESVKNESECISEKIFCLFDWLKVRPANRKLLLMAMMRAQRACKVSVFIFNIDRSLFLWVLRTAGSFITMLRTFQN